MKFMKIHQIRTGISVLFVDGVDSYFSVGTDRVGCLAFLPEQNRTKHLDRLANLGFVTV